MKNSTIASRIFAKSHPSQSALPGKTIPLLFAIVYAVGLLSSRAQNTWTQNADFGGSPRDGAVGFSIGNNGYIGTGSDEHGDLVNDFWEYNPATDAWTQKADFGGTARENAVGFSVGIKGYVGTGENYSTFNNDFWEYDPSANVWIQKADFGGTARYGAVGFSIDNKGYIGTGTDGTQKNDFWEYNPGTNAWTQKSNFGGAARNGAVGFSIGSKGFVGTGYQFDGSSHTYNDFWEYDPNTDIWTQKADFGGTARSWGVGFSISGNGYIGTGYNPGDAKDFWEYDPDTNTWTQRADFGGAGRGVAVGFSIDSKGYIGTGISGLFPPTNYKDFWEYTPDISSCEVPTNFSVKNITASSAKLKWDVVAEALRYKVRYQAAGDTEWIKFNHVKSNSKAISGLTANTLYYWQAKSVCSTDPDIFSDWSKKHSFTTAALRMGDEPAVSFELYPNPVSENFTLDLQFNSTKDQAATILLLNALGQVVYSVKEVVGNGELKKEMTMPASASSGWYILKVMLSDQVMEKKLLYEK